MLVFKSYLTSVRLKTHVVRLEGQPQRLFKFRVLRTRFITLFAKASHWASIASHMSTVYIPFICLGSILLSGFLFEILFAFCSRRALK